MLLDDYKNVNKKLTSEEVEKELVMQEDFDAIVEWIQESGYLDVADEYSVYTESPVQIRNTALKGKKEVMSREQYENLVRSKAALAAAKSAGSSDYEKLVKVSRLRKKLIAKINKQYASTARKTAKAAVKAAKKTSNTVVKAPKEGAGGTKGTPNKPKVVKESDKK